MSPLHRARQDKTIHGQDLFHLLHSLTCWFRAATSHASASSVHPWVTLATPDFHFAWGGQPAFKRTTVQYMTMTRKMIVKCTAKLTSCLTFTDGELVVSGQSPLLFHLCPDSSVSVPPKKMTDDGCWVDLSYANLLRLTSMESCLDDVKTQPTTNPDTEKLNDSTEC